MSVVLTASGRQSIVGVSIRDGEGDLQSIATGLMRCPQATLKAWFSSLSATASPTEVAGYGASSLPISVSTNQSTCVPSNGVGPFTYAWEAVDASGWGIVSASAARTAFASPNINAAEAAEGTFRCKVTDASGAEAFSNIVSAEASNLGSAGTIGE